MGTLEAFLVERYCLYCQGPDRVLYRAKVHHQPWPLQEAAGQIDPVPLLRTHGLVVGSAPLLHFSRRRGRGHLAAGTIEAKGCLIQHFAAPTHYLHQEKAGDRESGRSRKREIAQPDEKSGGSNGQ